MSNENTNQASPQQADSNVDKQVAGLQDEHLSDLLKRSESGEFNGDQEYSAKDSQPEPAKAEKPPADTPDEMATLKKQVDEQKRFIGRQTNEVGKLRKMVSDLQAQLTQETPKQRTPEETAAFFDDPLGNVEKLLAQKELEKRAKESEAAESQEQNRVQILDAVPDFFDILKDMCAVAHADGVPEEALRAFINNPWSENPAAVIGLAKRTRAELKAAAAAGKHQEQPKPKAKVPTTITSAHGRTNSNRKPLSEAQISKLSDAELQDLIKGDSGNE